jgi:benzoate membrane transport protein
MKTFFQDATMSTLTAGFVSLLVGFSSSAVIVYQAAIKAGATDSMAASWLGVLCLSMGLLSFFLSFTSKKPVMFAWSTAGGALLFSTAQGFSLAELSGAFIASACLIFLSGITGFFEKIMNKIPIGLASGMLAGVLVHFTLDVFVSLEKEPLIVGLMILTYIIGRIKFPKMNIVLVLSIGILISILKGKFTFSHIHFSIIKPEFIYPEFSVAAFMAVAIPLFAVTMASQNLTGIAVMKSCGYQPRISKLISWSGLTNIIIAPFGGYSINLSALTAAICMGTDSHPNPEKRYTAAMISGLFYMVVGLWAGAVIGLFEGMPKEFIMTLAGLALMSTVIQGLFQAIKFDQDSKTPSLSGQMTFFVTASGVTLLGISSSFWGLLAGGIVLVLEKMLRKKSVEEKS